jgi:hypothetical protein
MDVVERKKLSTLSVTRFGEISRFEEKISQTFQNMEKFWHLFGMVKIFFKK